MKARLSSLILLLCSFITFPAWAITSFSVQFIPSSPQPGSDITARVASLLSSLPACLPAATSINLSGTTITMRLDYGDTCGTGSPLPYRDYPLGPYAAGSYTFAINVCVSGPTSPVTCGIEYQGPLVVGTNISSIPVLSLCASVATLLGMLTIGMRKLRMS